MSSPDRGHPDPEQLAALALAEPTDSDVATHARTCAACGAEVAELRRVALITAAVGSSPVLAAPPPEHVWDRIAGTVDVPPAASGPEARPQVVPSAPPRPGRSRVLAGVVGFVAGAAAAGAVAVVVDRGESGPAPATSVVLATGRLSPLDDPGTTAGSVSVSRGPSGLLVTVTLDGMPHRARAFVEAWMLDPRTNDMLALGVMRNPSQSFAIPDDLDLAAYSAVDVSLEPIDGDPAHSADSLARGSLSAEQ